MLLLLLLPRVNFTRAAINEKVPEKRIYIYVMLRRRPLSRARADGAKNELSSREIQFARVHTLYRQKTKTDENYVATETLRG